MALTIAQEKRAKRGSFGAFTATIVAQRISEGIGERMSLDMINNGSADFFWGYDDSVTVDNGWPINPGGNYEEVASQLDIWVIAAGDINIRYKEKFDV